MISFGQPVITDADVEAVVSVLRSGWISSGQVTKSFEENVAKFLGVKYAIATSSGSAALDLAFQILKIKPEDEVIAPAITYIAPIASAVRAGARVVLADIDLQNGAVDPSSVARLITKRTKLIVAVDYAGIPADFDRLREVAGGIPILEDGAEGLGGELVDGRKVCSLGDISIVSFHSLKQVACGEGGMLLTNNIELALRARLIRNQGEGSTKYHHVAVGGNYRMVEFAAALGNSQLSRIQDKIDIRMALEAEYAMQFPSFAKLNYPHCKPCLFFFPLLVKNRDSIISSLRDAGVETRAAFEPVYLQEAYLPYVSYELSELESAKIFWSHIIALPLHEGMSRDDVKHIARKIDELGGFE